VNVSKETMRLRHVERGPEMTNTLMNEQANLSNAPLFAPLSWANLSLPHRVVMAPLTRSRAALNLPGALHREYYTQRASAALMITEATQISPEGVGFIDTPGIYSAAQIAAWKQVTAAVHAQGGRIVLQLWHVGRVSHTDLQPEQQSPVAPSAINANARVFTATGFLPSSLPRALQTSEIAERVEHYRQAAINALAAGFDGVELHGANGYLIDQFLRDGSNQRRDEYGGSVANRLRFPLAVVDALIAVWGAERVGVRLSPAVELNGVHDSHPEALFGALFDALEARQVGYVHLVEPVNDDHRMYSSLNRKTPPARFLPLLRQKYHGVVMLNGGFDAVTATQYIEQGWADLISFGTAFIANPDLPYRLHNNLPLNTADPQRFYGGDARGYTDYPNAEKV
jgi:N-ethylmaleimide reductase